MVLNRRAGQRPEPLFVLQNLVYQRCEPPCYSQNRSSLSVNQCRAPLSGPSPAYPTVPWGRLAGRGEEETGPSSFGSPLQAALHSEVLLLLLLLLNCCRRALRPSGSMLTLCCWPNCPPTNISSELLDHVKSITAVLTVVPHVCDSPVKVLELGLESGEKR